MKLKLLTIMGSRRGELIGKWRVQRYLPSLPLSSFTQVICHVGVRCVKLSLGSLAQYLQS